MPRAKSQIPSYRLHRQSGLAIVTVTLPDGRRKDYMLGKFGSPESKAEYRRICAAIDSDDGICGLENKSITVNEICLKFLRHAKQHYRLPDGSQTSEFTSITHAIRFVRELYGVLCKKSDGDFAQAIVAPIRNSAVSRLSDFGRGK